MLYRHRFTVKAPLAQVAAFHSRSASMGDITPPPVVVRIHSAPAILAEGDEMAFTLWLGPLPIRWRARIRDVSPNGFVDEQVAGPFKTWIHRHSFIEVDAEHTTVVDEVEVTPSSHWVWRLVGWGMWFNLPILFAFRQWKTTRLLSQPVTS